MEKPKIVILEKPENDEMVLYPESLTEEIKKEYQTLKIPIQA